jgi:hypothetical protein
MSFPAQNTQNMNIDSEVSLATVLQALAQLQQENRTIRQESALLRTTLLNLQNQPLIQLQQENDAIHQESALLRTALLTLQNQPQVTSVPNPQISLPEKFDGNRQKF